SGDLTDEDFQAAEHLPEEYKQQKKGEWNIDGIIEQDEQVAYNVPRKVYNKWPNARVPYLIDNQYTSTERAVVAKAIQNIQAASCVRFVPKTDADRDYIYITPDYANGYNCYSYVGRQGGKQLVKMQADC
ncbi:Zinc metalloproteinase nas-13-like protein, partial [Leptotrombidium deliense]